MYLLNDGTQATKDQIKTAFENNMARIVHGRAPNHTSSGLLLDGKDFDTRNQCVSVWEESWTRKPENLKECLDVSHVKNTDLYDDEAYQQYKKSQNS